MSLFTDMPKWAANIPVKNTKVIPNDTPKNLIRPKANPIAETSDRIITACMIV